MSQKLGSIQGTKQNSLSIKSLNILSYLKAAILALFAAFVGLMACGSLFSNTTLCVAALIALTAMLGLMTCYIIETKSKIPNLISRNG